MHFSLSSALHKDNDNVWKGKKIEMHSNSPDYYELGIKYDE